MKVEFGRQILEKRSNIKFHENPSSESWVVPCGRTERVTDMNDEICSRFPQYRVRA